ncbi:MAG: hypothetical protein V1487_01420 [bacterium]
MNQATITFRYSNIYDMNLCRWVKGKWDDRVMNSNLEYESKLQSFWQKYEREVLELFSLWKLAMPRSIVAYVVSPWPGITNFSDPLTIVKNDDMKAVFSTLCHELAHMAFSQPENKAVKTAIYEKILQRFIDADYPTRIHVAVNFLQKSLITAIYPEAEECLTNEKNADGMLYPGQQSAWHILDNYLSKLDVAAPIESLREI